MATQGTTIVNRFSSPVRYRFDQTMSINSNKPSKVVQSKLIWQDSPALDASGPTRYLTFQALAGKIDAESSEDGESKKHHNLEGSSNFTSKPSLIATSREYLVSRSVGRRASGLAEIAAETKSLLPALLMCLPAVASTGKLYTSMHASHQKRNPRYPATNIRVVDADTLDVAIAMGGSQSITSKDKPILLLNMANAYHGGGGWLSGALAQEEALCYRSSLSFTLKRRFYPIPEYAAIYSPSVIVIRSSLESGHRLLNLSDPASLPSVSVVSVAALRDPAIAYTANGEESYAKIEDRNCMKDKMRVILRVAGMKAHPRLVLGALGCGAFNNPTIEVARMWKEVLGETEWKGWFKEVVFAVLDLGSGNWDVFQRELDGSVL